MGWTVLCRHKQADGQILALLPKSEQTLLLLLKLKEKKYDYSKLLRTND